MALLHLLNDLASDQGWRLGVAHLNHQLRGRAARLDEQFVRALAASMDWPCHVRRRDVAQAARRSRQSMEMAAREARYAFFRYLLRRHGYDVVALAHTRDDQAETLLLRLLRGAGLAGLGAMAPVAERDGMRIVRPLLAVSKLELISHLRKRGVAWREDASNEDTTLLRNRVRHELMPLIRDRFNPKADDVLARTAELLREDHAALNALAVDDVREARVGGGQALAVSRLRALDAARRRRAVLRWLIDAGVEESRLTADLVERVCALSASEQGTSETPVHGALRVVRTYGRLTLSGVSGAAGRSGSGRYKLNVPGRTVIRELGIRVDTEWTQGYAQTDPGRCGRMPADAWLAAERVGRAGLYVRTRAAGDRFAPSGRGGSRKLQDVFVDLKLARERRDLFPLLECRREIVWVPGYRVARGWTVPSASARSLHIRMASLLKPE